MTTDSPSARKARQTPRCNLGSDRGLATVEGYDGIVLPGMVFRIEDSNENQIALTELCMVDHSTCRNKLVNLAFRSGASKLAEFRAYQ